MVRLESAQIRAQADLEWTPLNFSHGQGGRGSNDSLRINGVMRVSLVSPLSADPFLLCSRIL